MDQIVNEKPGGAKQNPAKPTSLFDLSRWGTKVRVLVGVSAPLVLMLALGAVALFNIGQITNTNKWVDHTRVVLSDANGIIASAVDMETGLRGYLLAGKETFLDPYQNGELATYAGIDSLQKTVSDNPGQVARLATVRKVLKDWQKNVTEPQIKLRREIGDAKTMNDLADLVGEARGKQYFDEFRALIGEFVRREEALLTRRQGKFNSTLNSGTASAQQTRKALKWVEHTYGVIDEAQSILAAATDMETGMRGFLLAGKDEFLEPYNAGQTAFSSRLSGLKKTVSDNPDQVALLTNAETTINTWLSGVIEPMIQMRRGIGNAENMDDMADLVGEARGKAYFDEFRSLMDEFKAEERGLMEGRQANNVSTVSTTYILIISCMIGALAAGLVIAWMIGGSIANPINVMTAAMGKLAGGDFNVDIVGMDRLDEVGDMARATLIFKENAIEAERLKNEKDGAAAQEREAEKRAQMNALAASFEESIGAIITSVSTSASEMKETAQTMSATAEQTNAQANSVAEASEEASTNVQTVAAAAEEMTVSIAEISRQINESNLISQKAVIESEATNEAVKGLAEATQEIGNIVNLIEGIAEQTNLLALNATIEAARAGEAGKGFAVVASEVKDLAQQTAKATEEIGVQIDAIRASSTSTVESIEGITAVVRQIGDRATDAAAAIEEQNTSSQEIAQNVQMAAEGTSRVNSNIVGVKDASESTGVAANQVLQRSDELSQQSETLREEVKKFLEKLKAA